MTLTQIASNPFAQMMDPEAVIAAVERSERLQRLQSRICRPLDKPMIAAADSADANDAEEAGVTTDFVAADFGAEVAPGVVDAAAFDAAIELAADA